MKTCQSLWTVMRLAHDLARAYLPTFRNKFSRHDFTLAQLFACMMLREHIKLTYRRLVALLNDNDWCDRMGMLRVPSTATLCRAFRFIIEPRNLHDALDVLIAAANHAGITGKTLAIDTTFTTHTTLLGTTSTADRSTPGVIKSLF
jgi:hypothetical protein